MQQQQVFMHTMPVKPFAEPRVALTPQSKLMADEAKTENWVERTAAAINGATADVVGLEAKVCPIDYQYFAPAPYMHAWLLNPASLAQDVAHLPYAPACVLS